jgi:hypothetical protein
MDRPLNEIWERLKYSISCGVERRILGSHSGQSRTPRKKRWDSACAAVDFPHPVATESGGQGRCAGLASN